MKVFIISDIKGKAITSFFPKKKSLMCAKILKAFR
jgi:hypothetical protein